MYRYAAGGGDAVDEADADVASAADDAAGAASTAGAAVRRLASATAKKIAFERVNLTATLRGEDPTGSRSPSGVG